MGKQKALEEYFISIISIIYSQHMLVYAQDLFVIIGRPIANVPKPKDELIVCSFV